MAYVITDLCVRAGDCVEVCPTDSIHFVDGDANWSTYYINPDTCIDCGACAAECKQEAIFSDGDDEAANFVSVNEAFYTKGPGKDLI
ncbi:MAG: 4Fe-4S binding protein [Anaerolineae bacterium]|nr:4Fe-4S binding protein [Anaerolineae bacterium]